MRLRRTRTVCSIFADHALNMWAEHGRKVDCLKTTPGRRTVRYFLVTAAGDRAKMMTRSYAAAVGLLSLAACTTADVQTLEQACLNPAHAESKSVFGRFLDWAFGPACGDSDFYAGLAAYDRADYEIAARIWQKQADSGLPRSQFHLATLHAAGTGVDHDPLKADELFRAAVANGYNGQYYNLDMAADRGNQAEQPWYETVAAADRPTRVEAVARADTEGAQIQPERVGAARPDESAGIATAPRPRAKPADDGEFGQRVSDDKANNTQPALAARVDRPALRATLGTGEATKNDATTTFASLSETALPAERPAVTVAFNTGMTAYMRGRYREALRHWSALAEQGDVQAQTWLGIMHENGQGVPQDHIEAARWFRLAADQGYGEAQFSLGLSYDKGLGVDEDPATAASWYQRAAEQGHTDAQFRLGLMYLNGRGIAADLKLAHVWFGFAAAQGDTIAQESMDLVSLGMTRAELSDAEALAQDWQERIDAAQRDVTGS